MKLQAEIYILVVKILRNPDSRTFFRWQHFNISLIQTLTHVFVLSTDPSLLKARLKISVSIQNFQIWLPNLMILGLRPNRLIFSGQVRPTSKRKSFRAPTRLARNGLVESTRRTFPKSISCFSSRSVEAYVVFVALQDPNPQNPKSAKKVVSGRSRKVIVFCFEGSRNRS